MSRISIYLVGLISTSLLSGSAVADTEPEGADHRVPANSEAFNFEVDTSQILSELDGSNQRRLDYDLQSGWRLHAWRPGPVRVAQFELTEEVTSPAPSTPGAR